MRARARLAFRRTIHLSGMLLVLIAAQAAQAQTSLDRYLAQLKTLRTEFSQVVTEGNGRQVQKANGRLLIVRPGRFRWEITPDGSAAGAAPQLMIADGRNLWFYDRDLEQVSVKPAQGALTGTPARLLSGDGNIRELFTIKAMNRSDGLDWVLVTPLKTDADFREARLAFSKLELKRMVLKDKLGQTVELDFRVSERNVPVSEAEVTFVPPAGADVIGTPVP